MFQENSGNSEKLPTKRADLEHLFVQESSSNMEKLRHGNNGFYRSTAMWMYFNWWHELSYWNI